ncbi:hypothetical protein ACYARW_26860 [Robinsoniella peoriensis]
MQRQCTEREGGGAGEVFGRLNAELAFSNLAEALLAARGHSPRNVSKKRQPTIPGNMNSA